MLVDWNLKLAPEPIFLTHYKMVILNCVDKKHAK